jgi:CRP/FNR family cyclic AMP-dependent transcriptional regulator
MVTKLKERFDGDNGRRRLREALRSQHVLTGADDTVLDRVVDSSEVLECSEGEILFEQGAVDSDVYFVLLGTGFEISVDGLPIAARGEGELIGEMAAIDPSELRSATGKALGPTVVAKLPEAVFDELCRSHPQILFRGISRVLADRLRERRKFVRPRSATPRLFVGSSREQLAVAEAIQRGLDHAPFDTVLWTNSVFKAGSTTIEDLSKALAEFDFALFVMNPDDEAIVRGEKHALTRDNVTFELGLFIGALGRDRAYGIVPRGQNVRRPSDLFGVNFLDYDPARTPIDAAVASLCSQVKETIREKGPR